MPFSDGVMHFQPAASIKPHLLHYTSFNIMGSLGSLCPFSQHYINLLILYADFNGTILFPKFLNNDPFLAFHTSLFNSLKVTIIGDFHNS